MGVLIPVGFAQLTVVMRGPGATKNSTFSMGANPATIDDTPIIMGIWDTAFRATGGPCDAASMVVGWQYLGIDGTYQSDTGPTLFSLRTTETGTKSGSPLPSNCAFLISKGTARGGRKGRGRLFFPPALLGESGVDGNGIIDSGIIATLQDYWDQWLAAVESVSAPPFLLHSEAGAPDEVTAMTLQSQLATQRRRMR